MESVWWRLLPRPLPASAVGEVLVRTREPILEQRTVRIDFDNGSSVETRIAQSPSPIRFKELVQKGFYEAFIVKGLIQCLKFFPKIKQPLSGLT